MIFVDDGSSNGSRIILKEMASRYPSLRIIGLKKNQGLNTALLAGMRKVRGNTIVTLDSDLQNDPEDIPKLLSYLDRYDMATGWRQKRDDPWLRRISSRIANAIRNRLSGEKIYDSACTLRVFKRECIKDIPIFNGMHRFLSTLVKMNGYRIIEVPVLHHPRKFGEAKYNIRNRALRSCVDLFLPLSGKNALESIVNKCNSIQLLPVVCGDLPLKGYFAGEGGYIEPETQQHIYIKAANLGISHFIMSCNRIERIKIYCHQMDAIVGQMKIFFTAINSVECNDLPDVCKQLEQNKAYALFENEFFNISEYLSNLAVFWDNFRKKIGIL